MRTVRPDEMETLLRIKEEMSVVRRETQEMRRMVVARIDEFGTAS